MWGVPCSTSVHRLWVKTDPGQIHRLPTDRGGPRGVAQRSRGCWPWLGAGFPYPGNSQTGKRLALWPSDSEPGRTDWPGAREGARDTECPWPPAPVSLCCWFVLHAWPQAMCASCL